MRHMRNGLDSFRAAGMSLILALVVCGTAFGQDIQVSGTVTAATSGEPLWGVAVRVRGTTIRTVTDQQGRYSLTVPASGLLTFALIGYRGVEQAVAGRATIDVAMEETPTRLQEVVVTGYTEQRRADITGAVASVNVESANKQTGVSALQRLEAQVAGVRVEASGSPGSRSTVRIRGISSFQNNDPLFIIDGTPVQDTYLNWLNPNEIESIQVLKDASAASIYGARANNGVVIIETKRGRPGQRSIALDVRTGVATPVRGYDDIMILDALEYQQVVKTAYENAGLPVPRNIYGDPNNPTVPAYIWPNNCTPNPCSSVDTSTYAWPSNLIMPGSQGTNWWDAVFGMGRYADANLAISGGGETNAYLVSLNYLDQDGTAAYTRLQRGSVRLNTTFNLGRVTIGENLALARERRYGGLDDNALGEDNIIGKNIFQQPVVPVYDVGGNFASGKAVGLSNLTNPLKIAYFGKDNVNTNDRIFGNVFAALDAGASISLRTRLGFNLGQGSFRGYNPITPENSEPTDIDGINENYSLSTDWTWSNTVTFSRTFDQHNLSVLAGQEANRSTTRFEFGSCANLLNPDPASRYIRDDLCDPTTKNVGSSGSVASLLSFFGKADYNFGERYYASVTLRRDGSSRLGPRNRWGTFPAVGLGWRLSRESFLAGNSLFSNLMVRFGWGVTGNQQIPAGRIVSQLGGDRGDTFYDIEGTNTIQGGFKVTAIGNPDLKWEENRSVNVGLDLEVLDGRGTLNVDLYRRQTNNLLFDPRTPATAGSAAPPIVNIGKMTNTGIDVSVGVRSAGGAATQWSVTFNGSRYRNKILQIDDKGTRFFLGPIGLREQNPVINMIGHPIGAFYGLEANGYYLDSLDAAPYWADGARPGRIKFVDQPTVLDSIACPAAPGCVGFYRPDGRLTGEDAVVIGSPHPDFTAGLDLAARRGPWDVSVTIFGSFGNDIFNAQKYWNVFRYFSTNVRQDRLANSVVLDGPCAPAPAPRTDYNCPGSVTNPGAKYPRLDESDVFSRQFSSFWVEDGTYVRLRTVQIGYTLPQAVIRWIPAARVYLQAENLFTITGYSELDPSLPAWSVFGAAGDIRDQFRGVDEGSYPSNRTFTLGITATF